MQYGLIGSMLLKRGAHDEAAQVFQKALELSPDDVETQRNLVRSLLAQKNTDAAMAVLRAAPRTAESLALFAEAQLEMGQRAEAVRTAEQALALDADDEAPRLFLSRLRIQEQAFEKAVTVLMPLVEGAIARRSSRRAAEYLEPILSADALHRGALEKMAEVLEAEGNRTGLAKTHTTLGEVAEKRGDPAAAIAHYRRAHRGGSVVRRGRDAPPADRAADRSGSARGEAGRGARAGVPGARDRPGGLGRGPRASAQGPDDRIRAGRGGARGRALARSRCGDAGAARLRGPSRRRRARGSGPVGPPLPPRPRPPATNSRSRR